MVDDGRVMEWAGAPVKGVVDGLAVDGSRSRRLRCEQCESNGFCIVGSHLHLA